jgi:general secretion pathway protein G
MAVLRPHDGFTVIELMVNLTIVGILAAIAVPAYIDFTNKARTAKAKAELRNLRLALERLATDTNQWPGPSAAGESSSKGVWDLNSSAAGLVAASKKFTDWQGPYIKSVPSDPWGSNYFFDGNYTMAGTKYAVIGSFGANRCCKNKADADDIVVKLTEDSAKGK